MPAGKGDIRNHTFLEGFAFAGRGFAYAVRTQRNMRIHLCFAALAVVLGLAFSIDAPSWLAIVICIGLVLALESLNTALEALCDGITAEERAYIAHAKDAAAGAVLVAAAASLAVAAIVFLPRMAQAAGLV